MSNIDEDPDFERIRNKFNNKPYLWKDVYYCIFENTTTFPHSLSFLCRIKIMDGEGGIVYSTNPDRNTYKERYFESTRLLNFAYKDSRRKILCRTGINLGYEGRILNDPKNS